MPFIVLELVGTDSCLGKGAHMVSIHVHPQAYHSSFQPDEGLSGGSVRGLISRDNSSAARILNKVPSLVDSGLSSKLETVSCLIPTLSATLP